MSDSKHLRSASHGGYVLVTLSAESFESSSLSQMGHKKICSLEAYGIPLLYAWDTLTLMSRFILLCQL